MSSNDERMNSKSTTYVIGALVVFQGMGFLVSSSIVLLGVCGLDSQVCALAYGAGVAGLLYCALGLMLLRRKRGSALATFGLTIVVFGCALWFGPRYNYLTYDEIGRLGLLIIALGLYLVGRVGVTDAEDKKRG